LLEIFSNRWIKIKKAQDQGSETLELNFINYRGKNLNVPDRFSPDLDFLNYHRYHIFQG
jgi:putative restriction endonuclease